MRLFIAGFALTVCLADAQAPGTQPTELQARVLAVNTRFKDLQKLMGGEVPTQPLAVMCPACLPDGTPASAEAVAQLERWVQGRVDDARERMPFCSLQHVALDRGISATDRTARLSLERYTLPDQAAKAADFLDGAIRSHEQELLDLKKRIPELRAARVRIGTPMPMECDGSEREFEAGLESIRAKIRTLRARATK